MNKTDKLLTNSKIIISNKYYNFLDIFSKEASDTIAAYSKYNHKTWLLESYKYFDHSPLHGMSEESLKLV